MPASNRALLLLLLLAAPAAAQPADPVITPAERAAQANTPDAVPTARAVLDALRHTHDSIRQIQLIDAIARLGAPARHSPADVKTALAADAPALLLALIRDTATDWSVRAEAMTALRQLDAADDIVDQAVAALSAAAGEHAGFLHARAAALRAWSDNRANHAGAPAHDDAEARRRATLFLRQHGIAVGYDALTDAIGAGHADIVGGLLTAGLVVSEAEAQRAADAVLNGVVSACNTDPVPADGVARSLAYLGTQGFPVDHTDPMGNTLLMSAAQFCPARIIAQLLDLGAAVAPVNKQHWTPLQTALVRGHWDVVALLVDHGARITRAQADQIFFERPSDPAQRDLLARATQ